MASFAAVSVCGRACNFGSCSRSIIQRRCFFISAVVKVKSALCMTAFLICLTWETKQTCPAKWYYKGATDKKHATSEWYGRYGREEFLELVTIKLTMGKQLKICISTQIDSSITFQITVMCQCWCINIGKIAIFYNHFLYCIFHFDLVVSHSIVSIT